MLTFSLGSTYELTGGTLQVVKRMDLLGSLSFGPLGVVSDATVNVASGAILDWSRGTVSGDASQMTFAAGANSESYFPAGFDPRVQFANFGSAGLVHTVGTTLVVPSGFVMTVRGDRPDRMRVEGTLRPEGSPASPQSLVLDEGGVEVAPGGVFNMYGAPLRVETGLEVVGGSLQNVNELTVGTLPGQQALFRQTSGTSTVNRLTLGSATTYNHNPRGVAEVSGGKLSIVGDLHLGSSTTSSPTYPEATFRQSNAEISVGSVLEVGGTRYAKSSYTLDSGQLTVNRSLNVATVSGAEGTLEIRGGSLQVGADLTVGHSDPQATAQVRQSDGSLTAEVLTFSLGSTYELTGGTLQVVKRMDLLGSLSFGPLGVVSDATVNVASGAILDWSRGTVSGDASQMAFMAGANSESYFPAGFNPFIEFGTFLSGGLIHSTNTQILVPLAFSGRVSSINAETLIISGELILEDGGRITAESVTIDNGTLRGAGTITTPKLVNRGLLAPGEPLGQFEIKGNYEQEAGGRLEVTVVGTPDGALCDNLAITGAATLKGELSVATFRWIQAT